ncbi:MAG TPA: VOC family protein [Candidatus Binatia bacterium]|nr:VOC family protein [Candidatus Binatia bacterium]
MSILRVAEAVLYVDDLAQATAFYREALGLPLTASFADASFLQTGPDSTLILFDLPKLRERQSPIPAHGAEGPGHVALAVPADELDGWRQRLSEMGIDVEHEQRWPQGTHSIYFRDPAGNSVELIDASHYRRTWESIGGKGDAIS